MNETPIHLTQSDFDRIEDLLGGWWAPDARTQRLLDQLQAELDRARILDGADPSSDAIGLGSEIVLVDLATAAASRYRLVAPSEADGSPGTLSILSPIGVASLGYREGDEFQCETPGGVRRLRVERVRAA